VRVRCENCGALVFEGDAACGECGREVPRATSATPPPTPEPRPVEAPVEPDAPAAPEGAARCAVHADAPATKTCARCGRFCCAACLPEPARQPNCPACHRRLRLEANPKELKRLRRELTVSFFFAALIIALVGIGAPLLASPQRPRLDWVTAGALLALAQLVVAVLFLVRPRAGPAFVAVVVEALPALGLFAEYGPNCLTLTFLAFPVVTAVRATKWTGLVREAAELAAAPTA